MVHSTRLESVQAQAYVGSNPTSSAIKSGCLVQADFLLPCGDSQNSSAYKDPKNKHLTKNVVFKTEGHEVGIPHFYATKADIQKLLADFEIVNFEYKEEYWQNKEYTGAHYLVLVKKRG